MNDNLNDNKFAQGFVFLIPKCPPFTYGFETTFRYEMSVPLEQGKKTPLPHKKRNGLVHFTFRQGLHHHSKPKVQGGSCEGSVGGSKYKDHPKIYNNPFTLWSQRPGNQWNPCCRSLQGPEEEPFQPDVDLKRNVLHM